MVRARSGFCDAEGFALVVGASGLVTTLVVQLEYEGTSPARFLRCRRVALDVDTSGRTTLVVEVLEVELAGDRASTGLSHRALPRVGLSRFD